MKNKVLERKVEPDEPKVKEKKIFITFKFLKRKELLNQREDKNLKKVSESAGREGTRYR